MKSVSPISSHQHWAVTVYLLVAALPGLGQMATSMAGLVAVLMACVLLGKKQLPLRIQSLVIFIVLGIWGIGVHVLLDKWLSGDTFLSGLYLAIALKWLESKHSSEARLLVSIVLVLFALSSLSFSGFAALAYLLLGVCGYLYVALMLSAVSTNVHPRMLWSSTKILLLATPVMVVLFVAMPRLQGPLWDLGIVMGLPIEMMIDQAQKEEGLKATLQAGQVSRLKKSDEPILVAEFAGTVPYKSRLYWRGPVYTTYNGVEWQISPDWDNRSQLLSRAFRHKKSLDEVMTSKRDLVSYEARISARGERWLYGLDFPYGASPETFISNEFQILGVRNLTQEFNYAQRAYLEYSGGRALTAEEKQAYLQLPEQSNKQLVAWGQALAQQEKSVAGRIHQLRLQLIEGGYQITPLPNIEVYKDNLDEFFFERKEGGVEHLASASAIALRAAGVPTRVVAGYRGGSLIALTNFVVVRQAHAHVWLEAWDDAIGWQRVEPLDFVTPPQPMAPQSAVQPKQTKKPVTPNVTEKAAAPSRQKQPATKPSPHATQLSLKWLQSLTQGLETWVLNYNPERQVELMKKSGLRVVDWKSLLAITFIALLVLGAVYSAILSLSRRQQNRVERCFEQLNHHLSKRALQCLPNECPSIWLVRIKTPAGHMYPAIAAVVEDYINLRYASGAHAVEHRALEARFVSQSKRLFGMLS